MQLIRQNPFHILGLLAGTNQRSIEKQKGKINAYQKVGKDIEFAEDLTALGIPERTNGAIEKALSQIEINQNKVLHSLFWFVNLNHLDETALGYLRTGDIDKSLDIWEKVTNGKSVNDKNFGAFNNLGTLKLFSATQNDSFNTEFFLESIRLKTELIKSESFYQYCHTVADETYSTDKEKELLQIISGILEDIKLNGLQSPKNLLAQISQIDPSIKNLLSEKVSDEPFHNIETILDQTKKQRTQNPENGFSLARKLYTSTKDDIRTLVDILGKSDPKYKLIADKLAKEILQCGIDYFQQYREHEEQHKGELGDDIMKLFKIANSVAAGLQTRERIQQNIEGLQEWIDSSGVRELQNRIESELSFITIRLEQFEITSNSVENAEKMVDLCMPKLMIIKEVLGSDHDLYLNISSAVVHNVQGMLVNVVNETQQDPLVQAGFLSKLETIIGGALRVSRKLGRLDMVPQLRSQFNRNQETLISISGQFNLADISVHTSNSSRNVHSNVTSDPNSSQKNGCLIQLGIAIGAAFIGGAIGGEGGAILGFIIGGAVGRFFIN